MGPFRLLPLTVFLLSAADSRRTAPPAIRPEGVVHAAGQMPAQLPGGAIAPGSLFRIQGVRLGPAKPAPGAVSVRVRTGSFDQPAVVTYAGSGRIDAIMPASTPPGEVSLTVTYNGRSSLPFRVKVAPSSFGIAEEDQGGSAAPGEDVVIHGTGLGAQRRPEVLVGGRAGRVQYAGPWPGHPGQDEIRFRIPADAPPGCFVPIEVRTGGVGSNIVTLAIAPAGQPCARTAPWLDGRGVVTLVRANMRLGSERAATDVAGAWFERNPPDWLKLPPPGACTAYARTITMEEVEEWLRGTHLAPTALPCPVSRALAGALARARAGTSVRGGPAGPRRPGRLNMDQWNYYLNLECAGMSAALGVDPILQFPGDPNRGGPLAWDTYRAMVEARAKAFPAARPQRMFADADAGPITIAGSQGTRIIREHPRGPFAYWEALGGAGFRSRHPPVPPFLEPGEYTISSAGTKQVAAFRTRATIPRPIEWTNLDDLRTAGRSSDLTVTWNGAGASGIVLLAASNTDQVTGAFGFAACIAPAAAGRFTIPARLLEKVPVAAGGTYPLNLLVLAHLPEPARATGNVMGAYASLEVQKLERR